MENKDLNIFVHEDIVYYDPSISTCQLFADACEVTFKRFDVIDILYQAISGFRLLINGPPQIVKDFLSSLSLLRSLKHA